MALPVLWSSCAPHFSARACCPRCSRTKNRQRDDGQPYQSSKRLVKRPEHWREVHLDHCSCDQNLDHRSAKGEPCSPSNHEWLFPLACSDGNSKKVPEEEKGENAMRYVNGERIPIDHVFSAPRKPRARNCSIGNVRGE